MTKEELITEIRTTFKDVKLEDGVGLWEGQGLDDYADKHTIFELRKKDERNNWDNISYKELADCQSSLSFFDAKGMRFCLPKFLIFDILEKELYKKQGLLITSDVMFHLGYELRESQKVFSLFNNRQIQCVIHYLEYKMEELIITHKEYSIIYGSMIDTVYSDKNYMEINRILDIWKQKLDSQDGSA